MVESINGKRVEIDYLYLDLSVCEPCQSTEAVLDQAVSEIKPVLEEYGFEVSVNKIHVQSEEQARFLKFVTSPTIRVNGQDIQPEILEKPCECCSELVNSKNVDCRVWVYKGKEYWAPPKAMIVDSILRLAYSGAGEQLQDVYYPDVPDNIKLFFAGKKASSSGNSCGCSPNSTSCCPPSSS